jgi:uncharacterized protein (TIGR02588 family)
MSDKQKEEGIKKNALEWSVFSGSLMLIVLVLGYLTYQAITFQPSEAKLDVVYKADPSVKAPFQYQVSLINSGGATAEEVKVEASIEKNGQSIEKAELTIAFSPKSSKKQGWINFKMDPGKADSLLVRVVSYKNP